MSSGCHQGGLQIEGARRFWIPLSKNARHRSKCIDNKDTSVEVILLSVLNGRRCHTGGVREFR